jgi:hypothetical protein
MESVSTIAPTTQSSEHEFTLWTIAASQEKLPAQLITVAPKPTVKRVTFGPVTFVEIAPRHCFDSSATLDSLPSPVESDDATPEMMEEAGPSPILSTAAMCPSVPLLSAFATSGGNSVSFQSPELEQENCVTSTVVSDACDAIRTPPRGAAEFDRVSAAAAEPRTTPRLMTVIGPSTAGSGENDAGASKLDSLQQFLRTMREIQEASQDRFVPCQEGQPELADLTPVLCGSSSLAVITDSALSTEFRAAESLTLICESHPQCGQLATSPTMEEMPQPTPVCAFCNRSTGSDLVFQTPYHFHVNCALWSPEVCGDPLTNTLRNVADAIHRGSQIKCAHCRQKGATVGCLLSTCERSYHFPCAVECGASLRIPCFEMRCPKHSNSPAKRLREPLST